MKALTVIEYLNSQGIQSYKHIVEYMENYLERHTLFQLERSKYMEQDLEKANQAYIEEWVDSESI